MNERKAKWRGNNRDYIKDYNQKYNLNNPMRRKQLSYFRSYELATEQDWQHYLVTNACECCGKTFDDKRVKHQHHDHKTGKLIGVWCQNCNHAEGNLDINSAYEVACSIAANTPLMELIKGLN